MTIDRRPEIPSGYILKELPGINASMSMPETWFYSSHQLFAYGSFLALTMSSDLIQFGLKDVKTEAHFMTRESIAQNGIFTTGVSVNIFPDFSEKMGSTEKFAKEFLEKPPPFLLPLRPVTIEEDGPLVIARRFIIMPFEQTIPIPSFHGGVVTKQVPPLHFYYMVIGNRETDAACVATFETPSLKWKDDRKVAETMIDGTGFSEAFFLRPNPN